MADNGKSKAKKNKSSSKSKNKQKVIVQVGTPPAGSPNRSPGFVDADAILSKYGMVESTGHYTIGAEAANANPYLAAVLDSKTYTSQYPDVYNRPTALYQQIMEVDMIAGVAGTSPNRFSALIMPYPTGGPLTGAAPYSAFGSRMPVNYLNQTPAGNPYGVNADASTATNYSSRHSDEGSTLIGYTQPTSATSFPGIAQELRPVSMHVWAAFVGNTLDDGGTIAMASVADGFNRYFSVGAGGAYPGASLVQSWEVLAKLPGAYSGPLRKGAYGFWRPQDVNDTRFIFGPSWRQNYSALNVPDQAAPNSLPGIVVSGVATQNTNVCIRLEICTVFEYITVSRIVPSIPSRVNPEEIVMAAKILEGIPQFMSNDDHRRAILEIMRRSIPAVAKLFGPLSGATEFLSNTALNAWDRRLKKKGL